jgi:hypothetical protein
LLHWQCGRDQHDQAGWNAGETLDKAPSTHPMKSYLMKHKDVEFTVVQTANPTGWKWTVQLDSEKEKVGSSDSRGRAIKMAQKIIDRYVREIAKSDQS